ncbi:hypothetical protein [Thalassospira xiamenensis]|jgi:hypothetical protein|uniref:hypothetical protein n=1 Tax=Thalassospira xiamenensis TaxID=220697 RepID=UPI001FFEA019|nr:hypothetical protein [Thalassospira xiamenensis]MCK2165114.1 hypothetical protein [Thalassospira xiamenensis]
MVDAIAWSAIAAVVVFAASQIIQLIVYFRRREDLRRSIKKILASEVQAFLELGGEARDPEGMQQFLKGKKISDINAYTFVAL